MTTGASKTGRSDPRPLRVMYLSPVGIANYDSLFLDMASEFRAQGTEVHVTSLPEEIGGFTHIEYRTYEALVTSGIIRAVRAAAIEGFDALAIGCFYDTGLPDAREISGDMIVTAPCLASCEIAASLSNRFGIIVGRQKWVDQMSSTVEGYGYGSYLSGFYPVELGVNEFQVDHAVTRGRLVEAGRRAVEEDHAEALILGCTLEVGFFQELSAELGVPVIDPSIASLKRAEYAAGLRRDCGWVPSRMWSCEAPPEEELTRFGAFNNELAFGNRLVLDA